MVSQLSSWGHLSCFLAMHLINPNMPTILSFNQGFSENVRSYYNKKPVATYDVPPGYKQCFSELRDQPTVAIFNGL